MSSKAPMPGMSGYAVAAEFRREPTLGPVTLNGGGGNRTRVRFRRSGASRIAGSVLRPLRLTVHFLALSENV
jgi:hypothetical protein